MNYSKATDYALHTMLSLVAATPAKLVRVQQLAERLEVSPTYLSKILTKLVKADMIESASGANGGYKLKKNWEEISFLAIIQAIEGTASFLDCNLNHGPECQVQKVMVSAEAQMENYLRNQKIVDIARQANLVL